MKYRVLGRTGLKVSELGVGGHEYRRWLPEQKREDRFQETQPCRTRLIERAIEAGVNYFDTTFVEEVESLGLALKAIDQRRELHISSMIVGLFKKMDEIPSAQWREAILSGIDERLRLLNTNHIDVFHICALENEYSGRKLETTLDVFEEMRKVGKIGWVGASGHDLRFMAELIRTRDCFDSVMIPYNFEHQEAREILFPLCKASDVGVVVMKPFAWPYYGISFTRFSPAELKQDICTPAQAALKWILRPKEVATVVPGINSLEELEEDLAAITKEDKIDEMLVDQCLQIAKSDEGKKRLRRMFEDPAIDVQYYARRALSTQ